MSEESSGDLSIREKAGHIEARPISWIVVVIVSVGFLVGGVALVVAQPWLFFVGIGVALFGAILAWVTHAMSDVTARVTTPATRAVDDEVART
ncbi:MAG: hypothetical protein QOJ62_1003 [Actinomycetota bacterium]|nr:hypothetical protein [Actinomycetota bacterium]